MMEQRLQSGLAALNLPVEGIPALVRYGDLLIETNKVMNLTAITDPEDVATLHFLDTGAHRESYDLAVSRAVAALPVLCELCLPLVRPGGKFLAMKSVESDAELAASQHAIAILGGAVEAVRDYAIPGTDVRHRLIVVEKVKKTPEKYPRMFAKIKKNPL